MYTLFCTKWSGELILRITGSWVFASGGNKLIWLTSSRLSQFVFSIICRAFNPQSLLLECVKYQFDKGDDTVKTSPLSCQSCLKNSHSHLLFSLFDPDKMATILLYSNENINIRHPASQSPSLLASHLNISYLQDISQLESSGLLSPARETTGKSETCHTSSLVICHERTLSWDEGNELSRL